MNGTLYTAVCSHSLCGIPLTPFVGATSKLIVAGKWIQIALLRENILHFSACTNVCISMNVNNVAAERIAKSILSVAIE